MLRHWRIPFRFWNLPAISVWDIVNMINLQGLHTKQCMIRKESGKRMMLQNLNHPMCQEQTSGALDSPVRIFQSQESNGDWSEKRSGIYFNIIDLLKGKEESDKPTYLFVENVKNLLSINAGFDFATVLSEMGEAGYDCRWQVLNSKDYGVPQNRERVFIIANLRSRGRREILSLRGKNKAALNQIIGGMQGYRVYDSQGVSTTLIGNAGGMGAKTGLYFIDQSKVAPKITDTARCLTARYTAGMVNHTAMNSAVMEVHPVLTPERMEKRQNGRRMKEDGEPMFTLTSQDRHGVYFL